ncbi:AAA family ATPase, partial [Saccharothrix lopnurensis]
MLRGRHRQRAEVDALLTRARAGRGGALVLRGGPGSGKSALLAAARESAARVFAAREAGARGSGTRGSGARAGRSAASAPGGPNPGGPNPGGPNPGGPTRGRPLPDGPALGDPVLGGPDPGGPAQAEPTPGTSTPREVLLCVDDAHLLDDAAWLTGLARDIADEPVALLIATEEDIPGLPRVRLDPLDHADSLRVLRDLRPGLPPGLADAVADLALGNPLALVELTRALTSEQLGGTAPPPDALPEDSSLRARFGARFHDLSPQARYAIALLVVDDEVDADTLARMPDLDLAAVDQARALLDGGPLVRSTLRTEIPLALRYAAHAALAEALPAGPRRTWHEAARAPSDRGAFADRLADAAEAAGAPDD